MILFLTLPAPLSSYTRRETSGHQTEPKYAEPPVVAYDDDVTVFVTEPGDFTIIQDAVECYEKATGAKLSSQKSQALPIAGW